MSRFVRLSLIAQGLVPLGDWPLVEDTVDIVQTWGGRNAFDHIPKGWVMQEPRVVLPSRFLP